MSSLSLLLFTSISMLLLPLQLTLNSQNILKQLCYIIKLILFLSSLKQSTISLHIYTHALHTIQILIYEPDKPGLTVSVYKVFKQI